MITTTLNAIRKHDPCDSGWKTLLASLGKTHADDDVLPMEHILDSNGLDDTLWCLRCLGPEHHGWMRLYAVWCARQVQHLMTDQRSMDALDVAERYARGRATAADLSAAGAAAGDAAWAAARAAARAAAWDAARAVAWAAAWAAAGAAAWDTAWAAARDAARDAQTAELRRVLRDNGTEAG